MAAGERNDGGRIGHWKKDWMMKDGRRRKECGDGLVGSVRKEC